MNNQNLTAPPIKNSEQAAKMGRKGGLSRSPRKKIAAQIREIKLNPTKKDTNQRIAKIMSDPNVRIKDIQTLLDAVRDKAHTVKDAAILANAYINLHKIHFGEKHQVDNINRNLNLDVKMELTPEEIADIVKHNKNRRIIQINEEPVVNS